MAGLAFVLRYIAGGSTDPGAVVTIRPPVLMGVGLIVAVLTALAPAAVRRAGAHQREAASAGAAARATWRSQTSLFLDIGVYLLIVGVVLDLLRALGSGIERDMRGAGEPT